MDRAEAYKPVPPANNAYRSDPDSLLSFDGKGYISAARAAKLTGYSPDYIGQMARGQGYATALLLYEDNWVGEAAEANIFWANEGVLYTPPRYAPILLGITRDTVIKLAQDNGIALREDNINAEEIINVEEIFLTGTATGIIPVVKV